MNKKINILKINDSPLANTLIQKRLQGLALCFILAVLVGCAQPAFFEKVQSGDQIGVETVGYLTIEPLIPATDPTPTSDMIVESIPYPEPTKLPRPHQGIYPASVQEIVLHTEVIDSEHLQVTGFEGDLILLDSTKLNANFILLLNLATGEIQKIRSTSGQSIVASQLSGHKIIWLEMAPELGAYEQHLQLFDLTTHRESTLRSGFMRYMAFQDDIIVWQAPSDQSWSIYGYNLAKEQEFVVIEGTKTNTFPQVCSNKWVIYLEYERQAPGKVDLYAHNLSNGQNQLIGEVIFPNDARAGKHNACDNNWVAWTGATPQEGTVEIKQGGI